MSNIKLTKTVADAASARQKDNNNLGDGLTPPEAVSLAPIKSIGPHRLHQLERSWQALYCCGSL